MKTKLGPKLQAALELVDKEYEELWDTCCDHGNLGIAFLESNKSKKVHFVDQVPGIMERLQKKMSKMTHLQKTQYELHITSAQKLNLSDDETLLCICGVGGEEVIEILRQLDPECDLLLSPHYHLLEVRRFLIDVGYKSLKEKLVFERKYGREVFYLSKKGGEEIDPIGKNLINTSDEQHRDYLKGIISHLEKRGDSPEALESYRSLLNTLLSNGITK